MPENYEQVHPNLFQNDFQEYLLCCAMLDLQSRLGGLNSIITRVNAQLL